MYMREGQEVANPDPAAGLYIRDRRGRPVRAGIPPGHLAFQMGQAMQVADSYCWAPVPHPLHVCSPRCMPACSGAGGGGSQDAMRVAAMW